jgi:glycosyltransferase involved in cell wall biosynthesis
MAEFSLARTGQQQDSVLCFHGLPPLLSNKGTVIAYLQNRNYFGTVRLRLFNWKTRIRLVLERLIFSIFRRHVSIYHVQTPSMARALRVWRGLDLLDVRILPFVPPVMRGGPTADSLIWDFVYLADGEAHKNHRRLIEAWRLLADKGFRPSLALTLSNRDAVLASWIEEQVNLHGLRIANLGQLPHSDAIALYGNSRALIFPSLSESFGLPLIEARELGLPILAGELDFVRDVCEPVQSFDPKSSTSIARAVRRFLGEKDPLIATINADEFIVAMVGSSK